MNRLTITKWVKDWHEVREYASTRRFGCCMEDESDRLSLYLAM